jgi:hypothetical protein
VPELSPALADRDVVVSSLTADLDRFRDQVDTARMDAQCGRTSEAEHRVRA